MNVLFMCSNYWRLLLNWRKLDWKKIISKSTLKNGKENTSTSIMLYAIIVNNAIEYIFCIKIHKMKIIKRNYFINCKSSE